MRPYAKSIIDLFDGKKRYLIPLYQRQYAWNIDPQLVLLWEDIERAVSRLSKDRTTATPHFMGAIVISEIKTFDRQVRAYEVIDGQQRLTTFQILLAALRDVAESLNSSYATEVQKYLLNDGVMETPNVEKYKLWPSAIDRRSFASIIAPSDHGPEVEGVPEDDPDILKPSVAAHAWFKARIEDFLEGDESKIDKLFEALKSGLAAVSIELERGDDPQTIFETLNSRGVDLTAGDLMRNFIFQRAKGLGQENGSLTVDSLYNTYWFPLDRWYWKENETRGRLTRPRLDWLLVDHLAMKKADLVSVETLFQSYRRWILNDSPFQDIESELKSIAQSSNTYQAVSRRGDDDLGRFGRFSQAFDVSTAMPLILYLLTESEMTQRKIGLCLKSIESFIVRRDICALSTNSYNRFFIGAISRLRDLETRSNDDLDTYLLGSQHETVRWPDDKDWKEAWLGRDQYKSSRQPRLRYLFECIEKAKRSVLNEEIEIKSSLTIEHIMPRKWRENWPIPGFDHMNSDDVSVDLLLKESERDQYINNIGNLTLLTSALNTSSSNAAYEIKMPKIRAQTSLALNRELSDYAEWNEDAITQRGLRLFETARKIWRRPGSVNSAGQHARENVELI